MNRQWGEVALVKPHRLLPRPFKHKGEVHFLSRQRPPQNGSRTFALSSTTHSSAPEECVQSQIPVLFAPQGELRDVQAVSVEVVGQRGTFTEKKTRNAGLLGKAERRKIVQRGVVSLRRDSILEVAEGFDCTLTSGKVLVLWGKALKETITNDLRRKRFLGFCVVQFLPKKMSCGPRQGTWKSSVGFSHPFSTCLPHGGPSGYCHGGRGVWGLRIGVRAAAGVPSLWAQLGGVHRPAQLYRPHPASGRENRHLQNPTAQGTGSWGEGRRRRVGHSV